MFLKSLTLRGFKSFADKTTLEFEPGITVIVGPNGSGKSNIVDAFAWVFGTHSAKSLRGGTMADVIFAGAPGKPALGRASVELTIDNSAGQLPIEFSEVTISRSMFSSGENEYRINNVACRLLDVQELLSDTGLGRENHTIVGQGQLDAVLNAKPEERRAFIEEAAGILKHRRRKERALRKLSQMEQHLERLNDVLRELRRNLRPLERQAEAAAKHAQLQEQLKAVRVDRALRELAVLDARWTTESGEQTRSDERLAVLEGDLATGRSRESELDQALGALAPAVREAGQTHFRLANLVERYRGLSGRIEERRAGLLEAVEEPVAGRDPEELRARARGERGALEELEAERSGAHSALEQAEEARREAERARRAHEQAAAAEARRRAEVREHRLRWEGEVSALRSSLAQASGEEGRLASQVSGVESRKAELERDVETVTREIQRLDSDAAVLAEQLGASEQVLERRHEQQKAAALRERELERQRASLEARADALRAASQEATEGSAALLAGAERGEVSGVVGALADQVSVAEPSLAKAVAAALGPLGDALVVRDRRSARDAVGFVRSRQSGRVLLLVGDGAQPPAEDAEAVAELAMLGARPVADVLRAEPSLHAALRQALAGVYVVDATDDGWGAVCKVAERYPALVFVSADGDVAGPRGYAGGSATANSAVLSKAAAEQAEAKLAEVSDELLRAHRQLADADRELEAAKREYDAAVAAMQESDGQVTAAAERLKRLRKELETCERELGVLHGQQEDLSREMGRQRERLADLESRGVDALPEPEPDGPDLEAERLDDLLAEAREREVQARLEVSAVEQRAGEVARRIDAYEREAAEVEHQLVERERRRVARLAAIERCGELLVLAGLALARSEQSLALAESERDRLEEARAAQQRELGVVRARIRELEEELGVLREARHA
ncbi:MAG TPA: AAA family ATPase, partial [Egibacteraceae bacterium]|nr:AAA family ATPase [Egibacteraceae bacterium]